MDSTKRWLRYLKQGMLLGTILILMTGCGETIDSQGNSDQDTTDQTVENSSLDEDAQEDSAKFPAFTTKDLAGNTVTDSIFADKDLTVLNIWGTFCDPCVEEMPELGEWAKEMPENVQIVGLVIDVNGDADRERHDIAVYITSNAGAEFTQIIANQDFAPVLKDVLGVPTTMFIDKNGMIVEGAILGADVDGYKEVVEDYLSGQEEK